MKHVWCIDDYKWNLEEGYVMNDYKDFEDDFVYKDETQKTNLGPYKIENIFENKETALNMYKGMIGIERVKIHNRIEELQKYDKYLFDKLLKI